MGRKSKEMSVEKKEFIIQLKKEGLTNQKVAEIIGVSTSTITKFLGRFRQTGSVENRRRSGRKTITGQRGDRVLLRAVKTNRRQTLNEITNFVNQSLPRKISARTVRRRLNFYGYNRRRVRKTLTVSLVNRRKRVNWCRGKLPWSVARNWRNVIFSDETQVVVGQDRRVYVWRKSDELWRPECLGLRGGPRIAVMFWGCLTYSGVGTLVPVTGNMNTEKYIETLDAQLWPVVAKEFPQGGFIFQDDNAPCHKSYRAMEWKRESNIHCLNWPSQSPDINVIENVWRTIKIKLQNSVVDITNRANLIAEVQRIWYSLTPVYVRSLYESIPRRLRSVIIAKGHITKY